MLTAVFRAYLRRLSGRQTNGQRGDWIIRILMIIMVALMLFTAITHPWFQPLIGQIARETARLGPSVGGGLWMRCGERRFCGIATVAEEGRINPHFGWRHTLRSWLCSPGYDMSRPEH